MAKDAPYQFYLEPSLKAAGKQKSEEHSVPIAPFMVMAWELFLDRPIEESMKLLKAHNDRKRAKAKKRKGVTFKL
jgi:hypothetical protein